MNNSRRKYIISAIKNVNLAINSTQIALLEEENAMSNVPEELIMAPRFTSMGLRISKMEDVIDYLTAVKNLLENILQK